MPKPNKGEPKDEFMKRCIPMVMDDGAADSNDQAVAICANIWKKHGEKAAEGEQPEKSINGMESKMLFGQPMQIEEIKSVNDDWQVIGFPSTFDNTDYVKDVIRFGSFKKTLETGPKKRFLLGHDQRSVLGVPLTMHEEKKGLYGKFKISKTKLGEDTHQLLLDGALDSFSIGYQAKDFNYLDGGVRELKEIELFEVSLVAIGSNPLAVVTGVKDFPTLAEKTHFVAEQFAQLTNDMRGLVESIDRPLSETKRKELVELLELCSGLDAVRSDLQSVLQTAPIPLVSARRTSYDLAETRKRLAHILQGV